MNVRSVFLGTKLAAIFSLLGIGLLFTNMQIGRLTLGRPFEQHIRAARAAEVSLFILEFESRFDDDDLHSQRAKTILRELSELYDRDLALLDLQDRQITSTSVFLDGWELAESEVVQCGTRTCRFTSEMPGKIALAPLEHHGEHIGTIAVRHLAPTASDLVHFTIWTILVHLLALFAIIGVSYRITRPLRQVSRSMDRIAQGELDHRVDIRGRDEVARMGFSFNKMADRVSAMLQRSQEILAGVSHELRSPLSRVKLSLEMLRETGAPPKHITSIEEDVDTLDNMVDELLTASRLDLGTATIRREPLSLQRLIAEAWTRVERAPHQAEVELDATLEPEELIVDVDHTLGVRLLGNLFENAVRHGGGQTVELTARAKGAWVEIEIADRGPGVPEKDLDILFAPFFRTDSSRSRKTGGSGLGLMIVQRAIEAHGSSVEARNRPEGGLVISFSLPKGSF